MSFPCVPSLIIPLRVDRQEKGSEGRGGEGLLGGEGGGGGERKSLIGVGELVEEIRSDLRACGCVGGWVWLQERRWRLGNDK